MIHGDYDTHVESPDRELIHAMPSTGLIEKRFDRGNQGYTNIVPSSSACAHLPKTGRGKNQSGKPCYPINKLNRAEGPIGWE